MQHPAAGDNGETMDCFQCPDRGPSASFAKIPIEYAANQEFDHFKADEVLRSDPLVIGISDSISDRLLGRLREVADHAR